MNFHKVIPQAPKSRKLRELVRIKDAKKIGFSIANSPLVKTAIAGEDPNWGRIVMAVGKAGINLNLSKLIILFGDFKKITDSFIS